MSNFKIYNEKELKNAVKRNTGKSAENRFFDLIETSYNLIKIYAENGDAKHLNSLVKVAQDNRRAKMFSPLIRQVAFHPFDKESGLYKTDAKAKKDKRAKIYQNWETIFNEWLQGTKKETKVRVMDLESRIAALIKSATKQLEEGKEVAHSEYLDKLKEIMASK